MKKISFCILLALVAICGCSSFQEPPESERTFKEIVFLPGTQKKTNFTNSMIWIAYYFNSAKAVVDFQDVESGRIIAKGILPISTIYGAEVKINVFIEISVKDEKTKIKIIAGDIEGYDNLVGENMEILKTHIDGLIKSYKTYMAYSYSADDW